MNKITLQHGDNREILKTYPDNHFDSGVCDPPYEIGFMGKAWDRSGIAYDVSLWREVYRVLKPGAHLLAFGGSRTYHRLACAIEDAGFQIRDQIMWLYGSGYPKSLNISKAIDKEAGAEREVVGKKIGRGAEPKQDIRGGNLMSGTQERIDCSDLTAPATALARQWDGWGTALKPAHEPIVVARKPLAGTVIENVGCWGCGGLNLAGCMIAAPDGKPLFTYHKGRSQNIFGDGLKNGNRTGEIAHQRWPANVIHDGSDEVLAAFAKFGEKTSGILKAGTKRTTGGGYHGGFPEIATHYDTGGDTGTAARFFYCAKASQEERNLGCEGLAKLPTNTYGEFVGTEEHAPKGKNNTRRNNHPTVKPLALMCYLVRLVTPPGGLGLDMFCGSGSTLIAYAKEGFDAVGIDLEAEHRDLAARRCKGHLGMLAELTQG